MEKLTIRLREAEKALRALQEVSQEPYSVILNDARIQRFECALRHSGNF